MNNIKRVFRGVVMALLVSLLAACGSTKPFVSKDGRTVITGDTQRLPAGRELVIREAYHCETPMTPQQVEVYLEAAKADPRTRPPCEGVSDVEAAHGTTLERDLVTSVTPVVIGNEMQKQNALELERLRQKQCEKKGGCGDNLTLIQYQGGTNVKVGGPKIDNKLVNQVGVGVGVDVNVSGNNGGCKTCGVQPKPVPVTK